MTLEEAIGRLKTYEERIKYKKGKQVDNQEKLMFIRHENKGKYFRGRGRGKLKFSQGRNHENFKEERKDRETSHKNYNRNNFKKLSYDTSKLQCYKCKKIGHIAPNYEEQKVSLNEEDVGYKEINMDSLWYLDNGVSNHMTGVREHFKELDEKVSGKVRFEDGSYIEIKGKGSILIECDDEKQRIISHAEVVRHAIYILNSVPTKALEDITPYEAIKRIKPNLENLKVFGCIAYAKVPSQHLTKLDDRSTKMVYLGNEQRTKALRLFDPTTQRVCVSRDVKFKENETWDWKDYMKIQPIEEDNEFSNNNNDDYASPTRDSPSHSQTHNTPSTSSSQVNSQVTPNISTQSYYQSDNDLIPITNSSSHFDHTPLRGFRTLNDLYENTEELLLPKDEPKNYKEESSDQKWIEAMKVELDSINRKNTWELTTLPTGHKAIGLKWVFKTKKDVNGNIIKHKARLVAKDNTLKSLDFKKCALEQAIYTKTSKDSTLLIGVYVDDLIITGTPKKEIDKFKAQMEEKFEMSDLGLLAYYLGIKVTQTDGDISIRQSAYANKILKEAGMIDCNETLIPMDPGIKLTMVTEGTMISSTDYRSLIGCLRYLLHTRPDLSYSVGLLSRFMQEPREQHMKAIRQVLRYVKGTKDYGITYKHNGGNEIHGFSDSSYGVNTQEGKGTTGIIFYYGESPISWSIQKQATVALSSCESEFIAATAAATQALWLKRLLSKLTHSQEEKVTIQVDNKFAIALMKNPIFHGRSKHIDTKYHFIRECVEREDIQVEFDVIIAQLNPGSPYKILEAKLESKLPKPDETSKIRYPILKDYIGGNVVEFTMWDEMAENFDRLILEAMEQPVIIAVHGKISNEHPLRICKHPFENPEQEKLRNIFPLKTLLKQNPESYK
nr:ribonuclease H-like domain, reverse transcriptase, RNA-dependent DNA polymerase [Tanacetum cinerariifolium]